MAGSLALVLQSTKVRLTFDLNSYWLSGLKQHLVVVVVVLTTTAGSKDCLASKCRLLR